VRFAAASLALAILAVPVGLVGCGPDPADTGDATPSAPEPTLTDQAASDLLDGSWMAAAVVDPAALAALLDAPGGEGWLHLYHGDLVAASLAFEEADSSSARLGMARVHLDYARALLTAARIHREATLELARYRRDHRDQVRTGTYELVLAGISARGAGLEGPELEAFLAAASAPADGADTHLMNGLTGHLRGGSRAGLPDLYHDRLAYADAAAAADLETLASLETRVLSAAPDLRDPLGQDDEAGVRFEGLHYDPALLPAMARHHLSRAWVLASSLEGPGETVAEAVRLGWGGELPPALLEASRLPSEPLPAWTALFASDAVDRADHAFAWGEPGASSFASRLDAAVPELDLSGARSSEQVDALLRLVADAESVFGQALAAAGGDEGAALVADLELARVPADRALRTWMMTLTDADVAVQGKRLGDRSLDANPGSRGGAVDSARTRVSYRNDRAFLLELARCLWRAGQTGAALDLVHPLAERDPALQPVKHYLGQLDAAASIGQQGQASQL